MKVQLYCCLAFITLCQSMNSQNWIPQGIGLLPFGYAVNSISVVEDSVIWVAASLKEQGSYPTKVFRSTDAGETWDEFTLNECIDCKSQNIQAADASTAWLTTLDPLGFGKLYKTEDGGQEWLLKLTDPSAKGNVQVFDAQNIMCQDGPYFSWSADGGETWETGVVSGDPSGYNPYLAGPGTSAGDTAWMGMLPNLNPDPSVNAKLVRSTNFGRNIEFIDCGIDSIYSIWLVSFSDHLNGMMTYTPWIYGYDYYFGWTHYPSEAENLAVSADGGESWNILDKPISQIKSIIAISDAPGTYIVADDFRVAWTDDHGANWQQQLVPYRISEFDFSSRNAGWMAVNAASINHPLVMKWNGDFISGTTDNLKDQHHLKIYPNPAHSTVHFPMSEQQSGMYLVRIMDISGRVIETIQTMHPALNIDHLPAGLYSFEIRQGQEQGIARLIKY